MWTEKWFGKTGLGAGLAAGWLLAMILPHAACASAYSQPPSYAQTPASPQHQGFADDEVCLNEASRQERSGAFPEHLLTSIALLESGRSDKQHKASFAWPWTVMAEGEGRYLPSKEAAIAEVRKLRAKGVTNIDVGCMQINLQAHPNAFASLDEAFDPRQNVGYAASFLRGLFSNTGNWTTAAAYYHSQTPHLAEEYKRKLLAIWHNPKAQTADLQFAFDEDVPAAKPSVAGPATPTSTAGAADLTQARAQARAEQTLKEREEARKIADAYRQARLEEWKARKEAGQAQVASQSTANQPHPVLKTEQLARR